MVEEEAGETRVSALEGSAAVGDDESVPPNVSGAAPRDLPLTMYLAWRNAQHSGCTRGALLHGT